MVEATDICRIPGCIDDPDQLGGDGIICPRMVVSSMPSWRRRPRRDQPFRRCLESPSSGDLDAGKTVTLTLNLSEAVTVAGGTPTLTLNDGGTATYTGGSGTSALTFSYTVGAGQNTAALTATAVNLNSASITDGCRQCRQPVALRPDPERPADRHHRDTGDQSHCVENAFRSGTDLNAGKTVTYTLSLSENSHGQYAGGSPTLTLNDGGTATYVSGSGTSALTFSYTVLAGQNTPNLKVSTVNLNGATCKTVPATPPTSSISGLTQGTRRSTPRRRPSRR